MLRLPFGVKDVFEQWLRTHRPERAERVLARVRDTRDGKLYDAEFGKRGRGTGSLRRADRDAVSGLACGAPA